MSNTIIEVENLSKQYRLGLTGTGSLAHDVNRWWHLIRGKEDPYLRVGDKNDRTTKGIAEIVVLQYVLGGRGYGEIVPRIHGVISQVLINAAVILLRPRLHLNNYLASPSARILR